jgi:uncharacterized RDD family membrane protein YckC
LNAQIEKRIGFGPRLAAFIIDSFFIALLSSLLMSQLMGDIFNQFISGRLTEIVLAAGTAVTEESHEAYQNMMRVSMFIAHFSALYMMVEGFLGASPGKMILGLRVGTETGDGGDVWTYFPRYLIKNSSILIDLFGRLSGIDPVRSLGGLVGMVVFFGCFMVLGVRRQAIHDLLARTAVFRKEDLVWKSD